MIFGDDNFDIEGIAEYLDETVQGRSYGVAELFWEKVSERTPVDTGRARSNWNLSEESKVDWRSYPEYEDLKKIDWPRGRDMRYPRRGRKGRFSVRRGSQDIVITNITEYIEALENGWSKQAPNGMVAVTVAEFKAMYDNPNYKPYSGKLAAGYTSPRYEEQERKKKSRRRRKTS